MQFRSGQGTTKTLKRKEEKSKNPDGKIRKTPNLQNMMILIFSLICYLMTVSSFQMTPFRSNHYCNTYSPTRLQVMKEFDWDTTEKSFKDKLQKSFEHVQSQLATLRASGPANPSMFDKLLVDNNGIPTPLPHISRINPGGSQSIVIEPFDRKLIKQIEKAIVASNLNLPPPSNDGLKIRVNLPPVSEERRKELIKTAKEIVENSKISLRNIRRDCIENIKEAEKDKLISKDHSKRHQVSGNNIILIKSITKIF
jgi:ribosome recycling factor